MKSPALSTTIRKELLSPLSIFAILVIASGYVLLATLLLNYKLLADTFTNGFPLHTQISILIALITGIFSNMHFWDSLLLIFNALFVGINVLLIGKTIFLLEHMGKVKASIGGAALISLITTGCASCGLSLLSFLGLSAAVSFLPFHGLEIHIATTLILIGSGIYLLRQIHNAKYCKIG